jgi:hypothetical protein
LFLFLGLAGNATSVSAQTAALQVQVYDYTGLRPAALHEFITRTQEILPAQEFRLKWTLARGAFRRQARAGEEVRGR